jgi:rhodanese-related sulfurtransferase
MRFASLGAAAMSRLELIDIRSDEEFAAAPTPARHIPMPALLADPKLLDPAADYLLICASGKRSLAAARTLLQSGLRVHSLAGGLAALAQGGR